MSGPAAGAAPAGRNVASATRTANLIDRTRTPRPWTGELWADRTPGSRRSHTHAYAYRGCPFINACAEYGDPAHPVAIVSREHRALLQATFATLCAEAGGRSPDEIAAALLLLYDGAMVTANIDGTPAAAQTAKHAAATLIAAATGVASATRQTRRAR